MKLHDRPRNYYTRQCRRCKGRGQVGYTVRHCHVSEECSTCEGKGFLRVKMPKRWENAVMRAKTVKCGDYRVHIALRGRRVVIEPTLHGLGTFSAKLTELKVRSLAAGLIRMAESIRREHAK